MVASTTPATEQEWEDASDNEEDSAPTIRVDSLDLSSLSIKEQDKGPSEGSLIFPNVTHCRIYCQCKVPGR